MKRRSFLAMLGLAPIAGVAAAKAAPDTTDAIVKATAPDSALAMRTANLETVTVSFVAGQFAMSTAGDMRPYLFDADGRCTNP